MRTTTIQTRIAGDEYVATTPHCPDVMGRGPTEAKAVTRLIEAIRGLSLPVHWIAEPPVAHDPDAITRQVRGLWPAETVEPMNEELNDGY